MKRSKFSEEQVIAIMREQEAGAKTADVCRKHRISSATFYSWKAKYGGMQVSDARRLRALEAENAKITASIPKPTSPTSSTASKTIRPTTSTSCSHGTGSLRSSSRKPLKVEPRNRAITLDQRPLRLHARPLGQALDRFQTRNPVARQTVQIDAHFAVSFQPTLTLTEDARQIISGMRGAPSHLPFAGGRCGAGPVRRLSARPAARVKPRGARSAAWPRPARRSHPAEARRRRAGGWR